MSEEPHRGSRAESTGGQWEAVAGKRGLSGRLYRSAVMSGEAGRCGRVDGSRGPWEAAGSEQWPPEVDGC